MALLCWAGKGAALPVSVAYPGSQGALSEPSPLERQALEIISKDRQARGAGPLKWNGMLSAIAREHSEDMAQHNHSEYASPRLGTFEYRLHRSGVSATNARYALFHVASLGKFAEEVRKSRFHLEPATEIGVGIAKRGVLSQLHYVTLILLERRSLLDPFPTQPLLGKSYRLSGRIEKGLSDPMVIITTPDGHTLEEPLKLGANGQFETIVRFNRGAGKYSVEITAEGKLGTTVLDLMHCYAGVSYPGPPAVEASDPAPADLRRAERAAAELINRSRIEAGLPPLRYDERLAAVARSHSEDMARNRFFAHVSPTHGDLASRFARANLKAKRFTENLAANQSLAAAHRGLMDSPGHRKNILDPQVTHVGVGIARAEAGHLLITQNFMQEFPTYDTAALGADLFKAVNEARAKAGLRQLATSEALSQIALENSRAMMAASKLGYDRARTLLEQRQLPHKFIQMAVFQSSDPMKPEQVEHLLKPQYVEIGIGIVQSANASGEKQLWTTVLLGEK